MNGRHAGPSPRDWAGGAFRAVALLLGTACLGALATLGVGAAVGMGGRDLVHLMELTGLAALVTAAAMIGADLLLAVASLRLRLAMAALVGIVVSLATVLVLARLMFVSGHDATLVAVFLAYAAAAGVGTALALGRSSVLAARRLADTAGRLARGDLDARVGRTGGGAEFERLASSLDDMATRLQRALALERELESHRRDLVTTVSHDLRTPLASLRAMVEAIDEGVVDDPPSLRRYAGEMRRSVGQLVTLVDDLFELVQLDAGAIERETERDRLEDVVRFALSTVQAQAEAKGLALATDLGGAADTACSPRLRRVLHNLLVNAVRHTPADGTIRVDALLRGDELQVAVQDSGEGIDPVALDRVFEPFFRADPARSGEGAGLGLALSRRIVEALGGRIEAESMPRRGSRFAVSVPARVVR